MREEEEQRRRAENRPARCARRGASGAQPAEPDQEGGGSGGVFRTDREGGGKAEEDANGTVHFSELSRYLNSRVRELSGGKQSTATERPHGVPSFLIAQPGH